VEDTPVTHLEAEGRTHTMKQLSVTDRAVKTRRQIELVDEQLAKEFSALPASVVHREVATVSEGLLADARFTDHVAVLTGRFAAEHLSVAVLPAQASADVVIERSHHGPRFLGTSGRLPTRRHFAPACSNASRRGKTS
jgi:hypothetical protein